MQMRCVLLLASLLGLCACAPSSTQPNAGDPSANDPPPAIPSNNSGSGDNPPPPDAPPAAEPPGAVIPADEAAVQHAAAVAAAEVAPFATALRLEALDYGLVGDGVTDNTQAFRVLLAGGDRTVHLPAGDYVTGQIQLDAKTVLLLDPGVTLRDAGTLDEDQALVRVQADNVYISGAGARLVGAPERYTTHVRRHGLSIYAASNVVIDGLESVGFSGSGFMVSGPAETPPSDVVLRGCKAEDNEFGGLRLGSARRVRVVDCEFAHAGDPASPGIQISPAAPIMDDLVVVRTRTHGNPLGGIVIDLQQHNGVSEPVTATIVEHYSTLESAALVAQVPGEVPAKVRYARAYDSNPRQTWQSLRQKPGGIVLSYYWPVEKGDQQFQTLTMQTPSVIDILPSSAHGSESVRSYWTRRGKMLLARVYPFKTQRSEEELYQYFVESMRNSPGIALDEVIAHRLEPNQRWMLERVLTRLRAAFPEKVIVIWDASQWDVHSEHLLRAIRDNADAVVLEAYVSEREGQESGFGRLQRYVDSAEAHAPGITSKAILGIGAYDGMRDGQSGSLAGHLERQISYIAQNSALCRIAGVAIYAPVYLTRDEQQRLDAAIRSQLLTSGSRPNCAGIPGE